MIIHKNTLTLKHQRLSTLSGAEAVYHTICFFQPNGRTKTIDRLCFCDLVHSLMVANVAGCAIFMTEDNLLFLTMDEENNFVETKEALLTYIEALFAEMEEGMAISYQGKYALLEDALQNATDTAELRVAFEQWYGAQAEEIDFEQTVDEIWDAAVGGVGEKE